MVLGMPGSPATTKPWRRAGVEGGLCAGDVGLELVVFFPPGRDDVPAQAGVDGEVAAGAPAVLDVEAEVAVAQVEGLAGGLGEVAGGADQEVGVGVAGLGAVDVEGAVEGGVGMLVDLVDVELAAEFEGVRADGAGEAVAEVEGVVDLGYVGDGNAHDEGGEGDVLDAFELRGLDEDAAVGGAGEALRGEADAEAAFWLADDVGVAEIAEVKLVDGVCADDLGVAEGEELGAADEERVEAGDAGAGDGAGVGIVEGVVVDEVVGGELAEAAVAVDADGALIVADGLREGGRWRIDSAPTLGEGMYWRRFFAGADHAACGMLPSGKTLV